MRLHTQVILGLFIPLLVFHSSVNGWAAGGCLVEGTLISTPVGMIPIDDLSIGQEILSYSQTHENMIEAEVIDIVQYTTNSYMEIETGVSKLHVTRDHPVELADGSFVLAGKLKAGQKLRTAMKTTTILSAREIRDTVKVYNLITDEPPNTYLAQGIWVHNKGYFLPDTQIFMGNGLPASLSSLHAGDIVQGFDITGEHVSAKVEKIYAVPLERYSLVTTTSGKTMRVGAEHPFYVGDGRFVIAEKLNPGDIIYLAGESFGADKIKSVERIEHPVIAYNVRTNIPNLLISNNFVNTGRQ